MNTERIKEIQKETAYPNSVSVQQALLKVWNECVQDDKSKLKEKIEKIEKKLNKKLKEYNGLDQISAGDNIGVGLADEIEQLKGMKKAFKWVLANAL